MGMSGKVGETTQTFYGLGTAVNRVEQISTLAGVRWVGREARRRARAGGTRRRS